MTTRVTAGEDPMGVARVVGLPTAHTRGTPTPWTTENPEHSPGEIWIKDADGNVVAAVWGVEDDAQEDGLAIANAAFIVRAANSHADLLAALEACLDMQESDGYIGVKLALECRALLAKAKGDA